MEFSIVLDQITKFLRLCLSETYVSLKLIYIDVKVQNSVLIIKTFRFLELPSVCLVHSKQIQLYCEEGTKKQCKEVIWD